MIGNPQIPRHLCEGMPDSRTKRTAASLKTAVYDRRIFVLMLSSDFLIHPLMEGSVKSGEGQLSSDS